MEASQVALGAVVTTVFHPVGYAKVLIQVSMHLALSFTCCLSGEVNVTASIITAVYLGRRFFRVTH
jgi:hypothetical protein